MWRDAHVFTNIEQKCTYLRVLLTGFVHDCCIESQNNKNVVSASVFLWTNAAIPARIYFFVIIDLINLPTMHVTVQCRWNMEIEYGT
jgi:hypothetical protein